MKTRALFPQLKQSASTIVKCWRIERADGVVIGFTEHDRELVIDGETYSPTNAFSATAFTQSNDMSVNNIDVVALISGLIREEDLQAGKFDNAKVRIFLASWQAPVYGDMPVMGARFGEITFKDGQFETELRSLLQALQQRQGRLYGLECDADLGDNRCTVDLTAFTFEGSVSYLSYTDGIFFDTSRTEADDYFQYGKVRFTSGKNTGIEMEVSGYKQEKGFIMLLEPMPYPIHVGDTFQIEAGCDKTCTTCKAKFDNLLNFQGFPHMPTEQEATETPNWK